MANDTPKQPSTLDMLNAVSAGDPLAGFGSTPSVPAPLMPALAPSGEAYAKSVAPPPPGPSLGTEAQFQAPANAASAQPSTEDKGTVDSDGTIHLPARTSENSLDPSLSSEPHQGFLQKLGQFAKGAVGINGPLDTPAQKGAAFSNILGRVGNSLALAAGTPEQKQIAEEQNQLPLKLAQIRNEQAYRNALVANNANKTDILQQNADTKNHVADQLGSLISSKIPNVQIDTDKKAFELETMKNGQFPVDPVTAQLVNRPDLAGKPVSQQLWKGMEAVLQARGLHTADLANDGLWVLDREGNKIHQISAISPTMARGEAYGANRPVQALDPADNTVKWMRAGNAEAAGAAPAGAGAQIMSKQAQFQDIYSGIGSMRAAINGIAKEPLDPATIGKLTMAMRETDPSVFHQEMDTILGTQQLTPAQQDFVIAAGQLNERALSLRNLAGMGNGSDSVRAAIRATLPTAKSGDVGMMRKQLDAVTNLVDNLYAGVPGVKLNTKTPNTPPSPATGGTIYQFPDGSHRNVTSDKIAAAEKLGAKKVQ